MAEKTLTPTHGTNTAVADERPSYQSPRQDQPEGEHKSKAWVWVVILVLLGAGGYFMYRQYQGMQSDAQARQNNRPRSAPITAARVSTSDMNIYVEALGTVTPVYTVTITSRVQGAITDIHYREGQAVRKGDPLIDIDPRPYQASETQMEGQLARDQALLAEARIDLDRYQTAYSRNAIAKQQLDDQTQLVQQDEGTVKNDTGQLENARVNLAYCHIVSPIDGRVGLRLVDLGNIVQANATTPLVVVTQLQPITVIFSVDQSYLPQIQQALRTGRTMLVDALDKTQDTKIASGTLLTVDNQVDTTTETVKLRASFSNADGALFPNEFVNARLLLNTIKNATVVPAAAIQRNAQGPFVYVVGSDMKANVRQITTGVTDKSLTAVVGVDPGDMVATNGFDKLQDGITVTMGGPNGPGGGGQGRGFGGGRRGQGGGATGADESAPGAGQVDGARPEQSGGQAGNGSFGRQGQGAGNGSFAGQGRGQWQGGAGAANGGSGNGHRGHRGQNGATGSGANGDSAP